METINEKKVKKFNIIVIICIIIFCVTLPQKTLQNDTFYTIKIGEHIVNTKQIDMKDSFSLHEGLQYTYPHWLYDTGIYLIYNLGSNIATSLNLNAENGGMTAIYISTLILSTILGILIYFTNVKISKNHILSAILTLGVVYCLKNFIAARAQLATYICFTLEILCIEQLLNTGKKRYGIGLFIIATLIANLHAAVWYLFFILALPYIAEFVVIKLMNSNLSCKIQIKIIDKRLKKYENRLEKNKDLEKLTKRIEKLKGKREELANLKIKREKATVKMQEKSFRFKFIIRDNIKLLIIVLIICAFAGLLTPQTTFEPYTHLFKLMKGNSTQSISEHTPTVLIDSTETLVILTIIGIMLLLTDTKITLKDTFMLIGLTLLTLMSRRQLSVFALIGVYSVNILIYNFINKYDKINIDNIIISKTTITYNSAVIILLAVLCGVTFYGKKYKEPYIDEDAYPVGVSEYMLNNLEVDKIRLFNAYNYGSYLLYKDIPVFIDSRCDLYTPEFNEKDIFSDALNIDGLSTYYEDKFEEYGISHVITYNDGKLKMILDHDDNYKVVYSDEYFYLYERIMVHEGDN